MDEVKAPVLDSPPAYELCTRKIVDLPPDYETNKSTVSHREDQRAKERGNETLVSEPYHQGRVRCAGTEPQTMMVISTITTAGCLLFCSWMCALGALYFSHEAHQAEYHGDWNKQRCLIGRAILLNAISIVVGLTIFCLVTITVVVISHTWL